jgi:CRP/FNR family transcriptional regulator, cyclic AMP receptor protein
MTRTAARVPRTLGVYGSGMSDAQDVIRSAPLFAELSKRDVKQLASALHETTFSPGTVIVEHGKPGVGFFLIASGSVTVSVKGKPIRTLKEGDHFGEIALIDDGLRMAQVTADDEVTCYALAAWQFRPFVRDHPDVAWALMHSLVKRLVRDAEADDQV